MTAPLSEKFSNGATTTLNGGITASATSLTVTSATAFPAAGNFRLVINSEILIVTAVSGSVFTVTRGAEGTPGATHANTDAVNLVLTNGSIDRWGLDNIPNFGYGLPYSTLVDDDGTTVLTASDFSWINQGGATVTDQSGTVLMTLPTSSGTNLRGQALTAPSTPYSYIGAFQCCIPRGTSDVGMLMFGFRNSVQFEMQTFILGSNGDAPFRMGVQNYNTGTSSTTQVRTLNGIALFAPAVWLKIEDDGTDLTYWVGMDGINWIEVYTAARASFIPTGPNQIFWGGINNLNTVNTGLVRLLHWSRAT